jgi:hypothetical protein
MFTRNSTCPLRPESDRLPTNRDVSLRAADKPRCVVRGFAIRSERALCREVQVNCAYRWFCGLSIEDRVPDLRWPAAAPSQ